MMNTHLFFFALPLCIVRSFQLRTAHDSRLKLGCVDLMFKDPDVKVHGSVLDMDFYNVTLGVDMQIMSYDYYAADASKTGMSGDVVKVNMAADTTSTYRVELRGLGGPESPAPCYFITFFDIDCNKQGCQKLEIDTNQFDYADYSLVPGTDLKAKTADGVLTVTSKEGGKNKAPNQLPMTDDEAKNSITFTLAGASKFIFKYTIPPSKSGGSFFLAGYGGMTDTPLPVDPEEPAKCGQFKPTTTTTTTTTTRGPPEELHHLPCRSAWAIGYYNLCSELDYSDNGIVCGWHTNMMILVDLLGEKVLTGVKSDTFTRYEVSVANDCTNTSKDTRPQPPDALRPGYEKYQVNYGWDTDSNSDSWWTCTWTKVHTQYGGDATFDTPVTAKYGMIYWPSCWHEADLVTERMSGSFHANFIGS